MIINPIPTTIITGFLGVGKTTAIIELFKQKPADERWAILINEFGEIGIDGSVVNAEQKQDDIVIKEVPGGCMCCAAGLPMKVALNKLIQQARPDRLIIEPTGLGHPEEVIAVLSRPEYKNVLELKATITLVNAQHFADSRYTDHEIFNQQLLVADVIVANKQDMYSESDRVEFEHYLINNALATKPVHYVEQGRLSLEWLQAKTHFQSLAWRGKHESLLREIDSSEFDLPQQGYLRKSNTSTGYCVCGWRFASSYSFDRNKLEALCNDIDAVRLKATIRLADGDYLINKIDDDMQLKKLGANSLLESRIEIISQQEHDWDVIEQELIVCTYSV